MVELRAMTRADLPAVVALERALFPSDAWTAELFSGELDLVPSAREVVVAVDGAQVVGYASAAFVGSEGDVMTIAVAPNRQRQGIGRQLMDWLMATFAAHGVTQVFLEVRADNSRAFALYEEYGFVAVAQRPNYYADDMTALVMRAEVANG